MEGPPSQAGRQPLLLGGWLAAWLAGWLPGCLLLASHSSAPRTPQEPLQHTRASRRPHDAGTRPCIFLQVSTGHRQTMGGDAVRHTRLLCRCGCAAH